MHSSNDAAQQPSLKHADLFSFPPTQRNGLLDSPTSQQKTLNRSKPQPAGLIEKAPGVARQSIQQPSPGILAPTNKAPLAPHPFRPNATRAIEQDGLGGSRT